MPYALIKEIKRLKFEKLKSVTTFIHLTVRWRCAIQSQLLDVCKREH